MTQTWRKFHGEKFMFDNMKNQGDDFVKQIQKFEAVFNEGTDYAADILLKTGKRLEYKSWKQSSFKTLLNGDQAKNQLKNYIKSGNFEYVIDAQKLIKDGVPDPTKFVREQFQEVFKKNADDWFKTVDNGGNLTKGQLEEMFGTDNIRQIKRQLDDINGDFYKRTIKIE